MDWDQPGVELTISAGGAEKAYRTLEDGSLVLEENGKTYWLGENRLEFSFEQGISAFVTAAGTQLNLEPLDWPEGPDEWADSPAQPLEFPEGTSFRLCLWDWSSTPLFLTVEDPGRTEELAAALEGITKTKPFELVTGGMIVYLAAETPEETLYYLFRGPDELLDFQNRVVWTVPEGVFDRCLALYAWEMADQLPEMQ